MPCVVLWRVVYRGGEFYRRAWQPAGKTPLWYATVDGASSGKVLVNIARFKAGKGADLPASRAAAKHGTQVAPCSEGGQCVGFICAGDWLR